MYNLMKYEISQLELEFLKKYEKIRKSWKSPDMYNLLKYKSRKGPEHFRNGPDMYDLMTE